MSTRDVIEIVLDYSAEQNHYIFFSSGTEHMGHYQKMEESRKTKS